MILHGAPSVATPQRILLIQLRRIGDTLLCSPAIRALKRAFPNCRIDFIAEPPSHEILLGHPQIDRLLRAPTDKSWGSFLRFVRDIRAERYDWAIDFLSNPRSAQFAFLARAQVRMGLDRFGRRWAYTHRAIEEASDRNLYAVDLRLKMLGLLGVPTAGKSLEIYADAAEPGEAQRVHSILAQRNGSGPMVCVALGNANPGKLYPPDLFAQTLDLLAEQGLHLAATSGSHENELARETLALVKAPVVYVPDARVPTLAALYRKAALFIGVDSAPKHIAAACGIPTIGLFGAGNPLNWRDPDDPRHVMLVAPCDVRPHCIVEECIKRQCLRKILPEEIVRTALGLLQRHE
jgi:heptosyltransferase III